MDGAYRADHDYWAAYSSLKQPAPGSTAAAERGEQADSGGGDYFDDLKRAFTLNPWEPSYPASEASLLTNGAGHAPSTSDEVSDLTRAKTDGQSDAREAALGALPGVRSRGRPRLAEVQAAKRTADLSQAVSLAQKAIKDNPRDGSYPALLAQSRPPRRKRRSSSPARAGVHGVYVKVFGEGQPTLGSAPVLREKSRAGQGASLTRRRSP